MYRTRIGFSVKSGAELTYNNESRTISGYAAIFGNKDRDGDIIMRGAFAKSIADRGPQSDAKGKIMFLWQHEHTQPLGRITTLIEDEKGLYFEAELDHVQEADRALAQLESGTLNQFSIGFSYVQDALTYDEEKDAYIVSEVKLYEISVVSIAANPETEYLGLKSYANKEDALTHLAVQVKEACTGLPIEKQELIQRVVTRSLALHESTPQVARTEQVAEKAVTGFFDCFTNVNCEENV